MRQNRQTPRHVVGVIGVVLGFGLIVAGAVAQQLPGKPSCNKEKFLAQTVEPLGNDCSSYIVCPLAIACSPFSGNEPYPSGGFTYIFASCVLYHGGVMGEDGLCKNGTEAPWYQQVFTTQVPIPVQRCDGASCGGIFGS